MATGGEERIPDASSRWGICFPPLHDSVLFGAALNFQVRDRLIYVRAEEGEDGRGDEAARVRSHVPSFRAREERVENDLPFFERERGEIRGPSIFRRKRLLGIVLSQAGINCLDMRGDNEIRRRQLQVRIQGRAARRAETKE